MSEYQYYEFRAVDRPLTSTQLEEVRAFSTRATITSVSFQNEYHWGDFKGNPQKFVEKYFDAHVYLANWGTRVLMFGFPHSVIDVGAIKAYFEHDSASVVVSADRVVMSWDIGNEAEWTEDGEGWMDRLLPLRQMILRGDCRALYLGWLLGVQDESAEDDDGEPAVPNGLNDLPEPLADLVEFLEIDADLVEAAAETSGPAAATDYAAELQQWITNLPDTRKTESLLALMEGRAMEVEGQLRLEFLRLRAKVETSPAARANRRTAGQLRKRAAELCAVRENAEREAAERNRREKEARQLIARNAELDALATRVPATWAEIEAKVQSRSPTQHKEALARLGDLCELAQRDGHLDSFRGRLRSLLATHGKKASFVKRACIFLDPT